MADSLADLKQLLEEQEEAFGTDHPKVANTLTVLADLLCMQNRFGDAEQFYWRVLEIRHKTGGQQNLEVASTLQDLATLYERQDVWSEAERLLRWSCDIKKQILGSQHPDFIMSLSRLGRVLDMQGKHDDVSLDVAPAVDSSPGAMPSADKFPWNVHSRSAHALLDAGQLEQAARYLDCLEDAASCFAAETVYQARILNLHATTLYRLGRHAEAKSACEKALAIFERVFGTNHLETMDCLVTMADIHVAQAEMDEARFLYQWAHAIAVTLEGDTSDNALRMAEKMAWLSGVETADDEVIDGSFLAADQGEPLSIIEPAVASAAELSLAQEAASDVADLFNSLPTVPADSLEITQALHIAAEPVKAAQSRAAAPAVASPSSVSPEPPAHSVDNLSNTAITVEVDLSTDILAQIQAMEPENELQATQIPAVPASEVHQSLRQNGSSPVMATGAPVPASPKIPPAQKPSGGWRPRIKSHATDGQGAANKLPEKVSPPAPSPVQPEPARDVGGQTFEDVDTKVSVFLWEKYIKAGNQAMAQRNYIEAERMFAVAADKAQLFQDERLWQTLCHLGRSYQVQKKHVRAESCFTQAQALCEKRLGPEHPHNAEYLVCLADLHKEQVNLVAAEQCLKRALHLCVKAGKSQTETDAIKQKLTEIGAELPEAGII